MTNEMANFKVHLIRGWPTKGTKYCQLCDMTLTQNRRIRACIKEKYLG